MTPRLSEDDLKSMGQQYPGAVVFDDGELQVVCRRMTRIEYRRYTETGGETKATQLKALVDLFRATVVHPDLKDLDKEFEQDPPLETELAAKYSANARKERNFEQKKL